MSFPAALTEAIPETAAAVIVAGGAGTRLPGSVPKPFLPLGGRWILDRTVDAVRRCRDIGPMVVVVPHGEVEAARNRLGGRVAAVIPGGSDRRASVAAGLEAVPNADWIVVHDGVRPFVTPTLLTRVVEAARRHGAATAGLPVTDTLKQVSGGRIQRTVGRHGLWSVQTPQAFRGALLRDAHQAAPRALRATDDAGLVEALGAEVVVVEGDAANLKITTPQDLELARQRVYAEEGGAFRVGVGYDVHRLVPGRPLILGGVTIPHPRGLDGHSDADVLVHAVMDALLGAAGERDIGAHFPPGDPVYRDADSIGLLGEVMVRLQRTGWVVSNIDVVVTAEAPGLSPHIDAMRDRLAAVLSVTAGQVGIQATTGEGLGPIGRGDGIAAQAVALIRRSEQA